MPPELPNMAEQYPQLAQAVPIVALIMGVALWMMGAKLLRGTTALSSLIIGGLIGFGLGVHYQAGQLTILWTIGGAMTGALMAWLMFRFWMAAALAAILGLATPATYMAVQDIPPPPRAVELDQQSLLERFQGQTASSSQADTIGSKGIEHGASSPDLTNDLVKDNALDGDALMAERIIVVQGVVLDTFQKQSASVSNWWSLLADGTRQMLMIVTGIGVVVGLLLGIILPNFSAATLTAFTGALLMMLGANGMLTIHAPDQARQLQEHPQATVITLGLISLLGAMIQWTIWRRNTDK